MVLAILCSLWHLSSLIRDHTHAPCTGRVMDYQGSPDCSKNRQVMSRERQSLDYDAVHFNHSKDLNTLQGLWKSLETLKKCNDMV